MEKYFYLFHIQYLGYRYHGWQKQPGVKTIEAMIEKTAVFVLGHHRFKILGASRTDAMVSARHSAFELFTEQPREPDQLKKVFNLNLPGDIRVLKVETVDKNFNIIQAPRMKEYLYYFSHGRKSHPFCAPFLSAFPENLDIERMKQGAKLFEGRHNFVRYCTKPKPKTVFMRDVLSSCIEPDQEVRSGFFPEKIYVFRICSKGFMRNQVRLIMGQLICLGRGEISLKDIEISLKGYDNAPFRYIAPPSGLVLNKIEFHTLGENES